MKRDWFLLGEILTKIEDDKFEQYFDSLNSERQDIVMRHVELLVDGKYVKGISIRRSSSGELMYGYEAGGIRITLEGYDLAEKVQDKKLLNKTMNLIKQAGLLVSIESLKQFTPIAMKAIAEVFKESMRA